MKSLLLLLFTISSVWVYGQETTEPQKEGWNSTGKFQLLFNQSAFNEEWAGGGTSSIAGNLLLDYQLHYKMGDFTWDNKLLANYGLTRLQEDEYSRKTSDRLEINSIAGKQIASSKWYYSFFLNFLTQFSKGYEYFEDPDVGSDLRTETTRFLSPAYLQVGPGIMWKKSDLLWFNIAPVTSRFIIVNKDFTTSPGYVDGSYYGVDEGESTRYELGASFSGYVEFGLMTNVKLKNTFSLYSNYLENPGNIDIDYLMALEMGINKFLSANLIFQAIYDDNTVGAFQIREVFGAAFNYTF